MVFKLFISTCLLFAIFDFSKAELTETLLTELTTINAAAINSATGAIIHDGKAAEFKQKLGECFAGWFWRSIILFLITDYYFEIQAILEPNYLGNNTPIPTWIQSDSFKVAFKSLDGGYDQAVSEEGESTKDITNKELHVLDLVFDIMAKLSRSSKKLLEFSFKHLLKARST